MLDQTAPASPDRAREQASIQQIKATEMNQETRTGIPRIATALSILATAVLICVSAGAVELRAGGGDRVDILVSQTASSPEKIAAEELTLFLSKLYPAARFVPGMEASTGVAFTIRLGTIASLPDLAAKAGREKLAEPESYLVTTDGARTGLILGADPRGVLCGVYGLLEHLGCGFYLTGDSLPEDLPDAFSLDKWDLSDRPLVRNRFVFNWHNFLSGCTGWNYPDWESWIIQSQKMGFNTIMVHAYGNNPMFTYTLNGITKEVGYYGTSRKGRDWGRQHINDVRRIPGGEIFEGPEFGSQAALVSDDRRTEAAQSLMKRVFGLAERRGVDVCFALDVDTTSVLQQDMIATLPESARFSNGSAWLPKPDTTEGAAFYRAQVEALLNLYPEIDVLALWRRSHGAEWGRLQKPEQLPTEWRDGYETVIREHPEAARLPQAVCSYALAKVVGAFRKALDELGRQDVRLAMGSWETEYVPALSVFLPGEVTIMPLDSSCMERYRRGSFFDVPEAFADLEKAKGRIQPIIWAHHDDGEYIGRPMKSHENFCDRLEQLQARGYGIIHWMKRPLDLHFRNHEKQVWAAARNQTCRETCQRAARHWFGKANAEAMGDYLHDWWTQAPIFGRVTGDKFFPGREHIPDPEGTIRACRQRLESLAAIDLARMPPEGRSRLAYFQQLEETIISFCEVQELAFRPAVQALVAGQFDEARRLLESSDPVATMHLVSQLSQLDGGDRGEQAILLSLGTRWLTDYIAARQKAGLEPLRIDFAPTSHEPLAQGRGTRSFLIDADGVYWSVRGEQETKGTIVSARDDPSDPVRSAGLLIDKPMTIPLSAIVPVGGRFMPGAYEGTLLLEGSGEIAAGLTADGSGGSSVMSKISADGKSWQPVESQVATPASDKLPSFSVEEGGGGEVKIPGRLGTPGELCLRLIPRQGKPLLAGVVLRRVE